ncbi:protoporphyrinogen oxidase HemJ [Acuticoccus sp. I52.16.1]|uniref:protoporphyrinogen oxidase HemJ n=1 Tax=Acuticoccus sp. I52.16.1 TaxID=2928472 RepID=UPI001FD5EB34|nr:protoporphyrinogen oxidase HemJ [Acuticoccus sp. I52.16.1]UOM36467.1 protoporphyrinogen oxidase HemJ [Acuticoccus sp. I52.16.1]
MTEYYTWIKAAHVISVIAWMAALLYLPRLMVYHVAAEVGSPQSETFKIMERRLLRAIANPAMIATWVFGLMLAYVLEAWHFGWFHAKVLFVVVLTVIHHMMVRWMKAFQKDRNTKSARYFRIMNEVPALLMIGIVIFVIVKPF